MPPRLPLLLLATWALAACDEARLSVAIADAPVDGAERVTVRIDAVTLTRADGAVERFEFPAPVRPDLLTLQQGAKRTLIGSQDVPTGDYASVALEIVAGGGADESEIVVGGTPRPLVMVADPDLVAEGLFSLDRGDELSLLVDLDLRRSVLPPAGAGTDYRLDPKLRLVRLDEVGTLAGTVASARVTSSCTPAVYLFAGHGAAADDVDGAGVEPFDSSLLQRVAVGQAWTYRMAFLPPGDYTAAFTCDAAADDPAADDALVFDATDVTVQEEATVRADFP